jgi:hypothetical protein
MTKKNGKYIFITIFVFTTALFYSLEIPSHAKLLLHRLASVNAASNQDNTLYIPVLFDRYPMNTLFGIQMVDSNPSKGFQAVMEANASWIKHNGVIWSEIETTKGERNWESMSALEPVLIKASSAGIKVVLVIRSTPTWAQQIPGAYCGPIRPEELASFGNFVYDVVTRYSAAPYNVKYWEIWNEPDVPSMPDFYNKAWGCWGDQTDDYYGGGYFAEMLKIVYPKIKAAAPRAQVLVGGLLLDCDPRPSSNWCGNYYHDDRPPKFIEGILRNNGGSYFDAIAFHAYDHFYYTDLSLGEYDNPNWGSAWDGVLRDGTITNRIGPVSTYKADYLRGLLAQYNVTGKYLLNTEAAIICGAPGTIPPGCEPEDDSLFEQTKARYVRPYLCCCSKRWIACEHMVRHLRMAELWLAVRGFEPPSCLLRLWNCQRAVWRSCIYQECQHLSRCPDL